MNTRTAEIKFRTTDSLKEETKDVYAKWGMTLSEAFNLFMRKSVEVGGLPFDVRPEPRLDVSRINVIKPDPDTGMTVLPEWMNDSKDDGLYDDLA